MKLQFQSTRNEILTHLPKNVNNLKLLSIKKNIHNVAFDGDENNMIKI